MANSVRVGLIGSQFISRIHARSLAHCREAELWAVASPTAGHAEQLAGEFHARRHFTDYRRMLDQPEIDMIVIGAPNDLHCEMTRDAANAGKHVVCEKPLCLNLAEVHGSEGVAYADLLHGNSIETYSTRGYDYAVEKAATTTGWSFTIYEEEWNYGFHQELAHFVDCVQHGRQPAVTGEDGRVVLEAIFAAYQSAGTGRKVELPLPTDAVRPYDLWRPMQPS
jgi:predicted dehydrogenase